MESDIKPYANTDFTRPDVTSNEGPKKVQTSSKSINEGPKGAQTSSKSIYILYVLLFLIIILLAVGAYVFVKMDTEVKRIQVLAVESASELQKLSETTTLQFTKAPATTTTTPGLTIKDLNSSFDDLITRLEQETQQRKTEISSIERKIQKAEDNVKNADIKTSKLENLLNSKTSSLLNSVNALNKATGGWYNASNSLYYKFFTTPVLSYSAATAFCRNMQARIAATGFRSSTVRREIIDHVVAPALPEYKYVWIGLDDISTEGSWIWQDGSNSSTNWGPGEPNNSGNEDCVVSRGNKWVFNDFPCTGSHYFVCEK